MALMVYYMCDTNADDDDHNDEEEEEYECMANYS